MTRFDDRYKIMKTKRIFAVASMTCLFLAFVGCGKETNTNSKTQGSIKELPKDAMILLKGPVTPQICRDCDTMLQEIVKNHPDDVIARNNLAVIRALEGKFNDAKPLLLYAKEHAAGIKCKQFSKFVAVQTPNGTTCLTIIFPIDLDVTAFEKSQPTDERYIAFPSSYEGGQTFSYASGGIDKSITPCAVISTSSGKNVLLELQHATTVYLNTQNNTVDALSVILANNSWLE